MMSIRALFIAALIAVVPAADAVAQSRDRDRGQDRYEQQRPSNDRGGQRGDSGRGDARRAPPGQVAREVQNGRPGRMVGIREQGGDYVVRWEYPGGRVSDIEVDGRSGRPRGN